MYLSSPIHENSTKRLCVIKIGNMALVIFPNNKKDIIRANVIKDTINLSLLWCLSYCIKISDIVNSSASIISAVITIISLYNI